MRPNIRSDDKVLYARNLSLELSFFLTPLAQYPSLHRLSRVVTAYTLAVSEDGKAVVALTEASGPVFLEKSLETLPCELLPEMRGLLTVDFVLDVERFGIGSFVGASNQPD